MDNLYQIADHGQSRLLGEFPKRLNVLYMESQYPDSPLRVWQCALSGCRTFYWCDLNPNVDAPKIVLHEGYCSDECEQVDELLKRDAVERGNL